MFVLFVVFAELREDFFFLESLLLQLGTDQEHKCALSVLFIVFPLTLVFRRFCLLNTFAVLDIVNPWAFVRVLVFEIFVLAFAVEKTVLEIATVLIVFGELSALTVEL